VVMLPVMRTVLSLVPTVASAGKFSNSGDIPRSYNRDTTPSGRGAIRFRVSGGQGPMFEYEHNYFES
jgi:hypothetical protein